jgi:hypothetical protein
VAATPIFGNAGVATDSQYSCGKRTERATWPLAE